MSIQDKVDASKVEVLFSHSYFYKYDPKQWERKMPFPPLGTIYAAALLRKNDISVDLFDVGLVSNPESVIAPLDASKPSYFVIYDDGFNYLTKMCLTNMREAAFKMIAYAKERNCTVIVNSSDSTDHYEKYLDKGADFILKGEGEFALLELIKGLNEGQPVHDMLSLIYKANGAVKVNPNRPVLKDLDMLPQPAWDLINVQDYKNIWAQGQKEFTLNIATTRGCPFKCNWCAKPIYGNRYNSHSPEYIVRLIKHLQNEFGVNRFWMCDDIFGLKPNWVQEFNSLVKKEDLKFSYFIQSRADLLLKEDSIDALSESGLEEAWIGAESGSQKILDAMDKGTTIEQIQEATHLLKSKNVRVAFFIQYGYLGETKEDIAKTIKMIKKLLPDDLGISVSYPLPGTKFFNIVKKDFGDKVNWEDSDELAMMFKGTFNSQYYKKLHRYTHLEYRISKGIQSLKGIFNRRLSLRKVKDIVALGYRVPIAWVSRLVLNKLQNNVS